MINLQEEREVCRDTLQRPREAGIDETHLQHRQLTAVGESWQRSEAGEWLQAGVILAGGSQDV